MKTPIDVVVTTWYRPDITKKCIQSINQNTKRDSIRLIVIDNNSPNDMQDMLRELQDEGLIDNLILNEMNVGLEPAHNQALELIESDLFVTVDNDCLAPKLKDGQDWLERMVDLMERYPDYAAISLRTDPMIGTGNPFDGFEQDEVLDFPHPGGSFRIMRTELVKKVGGWRNHVEGRGTEERYICGKLREIGYKTGFAVQIRTLHLFGERGTQGTDRWGYPKDWSPEDTGHSDIWHPKLGSGDDHNEIKQFIDEV